MLGAFDNFWEGLDRANDALIAMGPVGAEVGAGEELGEKSLGEAGAILRDANASGIEAAKVAEATGDLIKSAYDLAQAEKRAEAALKAKKCLHRPYVRKPVRKAVNDAAPRTPDGKPIDPNTLKPIDGTPDLGHTPGNENWREIEQAETEGLTQEEFNDRMNDPDKYQLEDPSSNRSHEHEQP